MKPQKASSGGPPWWATLMVGITIVMLMTSTSCAFCYSF